MLPHEARLHAGTATVDVTPDDPVVMSGYGARDGRSTGVNDPLFASALVLDDGATTVGIASVDALSVSRELTRAVTKTLVAEGVDLETVILAATHTHAGPYVPARALDVSPPLRATEDVSGAVESLEDGIVDAFARAYERTEPARIRVGHATEREVLVNRRAAGGVSGNVRMPDGPIDPRVTALLVETESGAETVVYNVACHPVCTTAEETLLSADWPGYARERLEAERNGVTVLFLNGAAGDINPAGLDADRSGSAVYDCMDRVGSRIVDAVCRALEDAASDDAQTVRRAPIRVDEADLRLPVKRTPAPETIEARIDDLDSRLAALERAGDEVGREKVWRDRQYAEELLAIARWDARFLPAQLPYVEVGPVGLLGMPGEVHARHGLRLRERARVPSLLPVGYANGYVGYVPTLDDLENGGYEVRTMKTAPDAIVEFRDRALELVGGLEPHRLGSEPNSERHNSYRDRA